MKTRIRTGMNQPRRRRRRSEELRRRDAGGLTDLGCGFAEAVWILLCIRTKMDVKMSAKIGIGEIYPEGGVLWRYLYLVNKRASF